jgi:membrane-associated phospholipid phosphatase
MAANMISPAVPVGDGQFSDNRLDETSAMWSSPAATHPPSLVPLLKDVLTSSTEPHQNPSSSIVQTVWSTYAVWALWVAVAFFTVYPTCNWITSHRSDTFSLYVEAELGIPFVPQFIWMYLSMYVLFLTPPFYLNVSQLSALGKQLVLATLVSGCIFLLFPAKLGFARTLPDDLLYRPVFADLFALDLPHNMAPALHVVFSALILFAILEASDAGHLKLLWWGWLIAICVSTILVHQHHLIDVVSGLLVATMISRSIKKGETYA